MKKVITLLLAFALILGMSQCKKNVETISSVPSVYITLDVDGGDKVIVDPHGGSNYATVKFEQGDVIYVGNNGAYCGYLTHDGTKFGGNIKPTSGNDADFLHFYFMGNKGPIGSAPSSVNISDQTAKYPVISYGRSIQMYNSGTTSYSATLYNKCSIMKFPIDGAGTDKAVTITGMNNMVAVDFSKNTTGPVVNPYTYGEEGYGQITLHSENINEKWAIVLPQSAVEVRLQANGYNGQYVSVPAISTNEYHNDDISAITLTEILPLFSVSDTTQVIFSPGNLQAVFAEANSSSCTWQFAPTQYSYMGDGDASANTAVGNNCVTTPGTVDLFGWVGASGTLAPYGINNSTTDSDYGTIAGEALKSDWSVAANAANLGGHNDWRILTSAEWQYLFHEGTSYTNPARAYKFAAATVNGVSGIVLLPDDWWDIPVGCTFTAGFSGGWNRNIYNVQQWASMEANGAVFLPAACYRIGTSFIGLTGATGYYWSSTVFDENEAYAISFSHTHVTPARYGQARYLGLSVRLVRPN